MPSANLDLVRSIFAAWERGDFSSADWADPEVEFVIAGGPEPGRWSGLPGMLEGFRGFLSAWEDYGVEAQEYREVDGECVLVRVRFSGRGKTSGQNIELYERVMAALDAREMSDDVAAEILARVFRIEKLGTAITAKTYHGASGVREWSPTRSVRVRVPEF